MTKHASGLPWSDGVWARQDASQATAFANWRGRPLDNVNAFTSRENWPAQLNDAWATAVPQGFDASRDDFILSVPLWTDDGSAGTDDQWKQLATQLAAVDSNGYVRLGWEMNCCFSLAKDANTWRTQFARASGLLKAAAPNLKIVFNPNEGGSSNGAVADPSTLFVDGAVDVVAIDAYDWYPAYNSDSNWAQHRDKTFGWEYWYNFAQSKGLPFAVPEFGVYTGSSASGGDDPSYITNVYNWLASKAAAKPGSIAFVSYFNESASYCQCNLYPTSPNPNAGERYKEVLASLAK